MLEEIVERKKVESIAKHFEGILEILGLDTSDPGLEKTPERIARMYVEELFTGLDPENFPVLSHTDFRAAECDDHLVMIRDIRVQSLCMHHFVPFLGVCHIGYVPNGKVLGLSKFHRIVDFFAKKPQLQEKLTQEIAYCLSHALGTEDIAVQMKASHQCVAIRGIRDEASLTLTQTFKGCFAKDPSKKEEFLLSLSS